MGRTNKRKQLPAQSPPAGVGKWNDTRKASKAGTSSRTKSVSPRNAGPVASSGASFQWSARRLDHEFHGDWNWHLDASESKNVLSFLEQMQELTWGEIESQRTGGKARHKKHHSMPVEALCKEAQEQLLECFTGDEEVPDELFRFRMSGTGRLWGHRVRDRFEMIWFDRNHRVYPMDG